MVENQNALVRAFTSLEHNPRNDDTVLQVDMRIGDVRLYIIFVISVETEEKQY